MTAFHEAPSAGATAALAARMQALIPVIETDRLILRAPKIEDFQPFAETVLGPQGRHYGHPKTREDAWGEFIQLTGTWLLRGHGALTITDRASGAVLGMVHIGAEPGDREPELGFLVSSDAEGEGIAFEAARALRNYADATLGLDSMVSYIEPDNARSAALAERLGATRDEQAEAAFDEPLFVYRHTLARRTS